MRRHANAKFPLLLALLIVGACTEAPAPNAADFVFTNGKVYTSNDAQPWAEAVAVAGTDIVFVGSSANAAAYVGDGTEEVDLAGKVMLPGIVSTHDHPLMTMAISSGGTLTFSLDADTMLEEARAYLEANPDGPFFTFGGATENTVPITKERIDAIISDRPFLMVASTGHGGWINSAGLEALGVTADTPDPIDSFERDENGEPTGNIPSSAAVMYALVELGVLEREATMARADDVLGGLSALGITAIVDPGQAPGTEELLFSVVEELENNGRLPIRIVAAAMTQRERHIAGALEVLREYGPRYSSELFNVNVLKLHGGSPDGYTSALLEPYSDRPDYYGEVPYSPEAQAEAALAAAEMGYDIHTHAIGDKNIRQALDTYQAVREAGYGDIRLTTGHTGLVHPDDLPRYVELDVIANTYGLRNAEPNAGPLAARFGPERLEYFQPMKSFLDLGVRLTASADWPTSPIEPFQQITVFMTRSTPDTDEHMPPLRETLTLEQALRAYTIDAAYQLRLEDKIGSLEAGKRADLIVIDQDIFELTPDEIWDTTVVTTMMNGRVTHQR